MFRRSDFRLEPWHVPLLVAAVLLVGVALWSLPRPVNDVVSVDGANRWDRANAPPQRSIVWKPAAPVPVTVANARPQDSVVRPLLTDGGVTLYFTLQRADGDADIYRSRFDGQQWLPGEPVSALNSPGDDFGPAISADGGELYLASDRAGGEGGFDVYVSHRTPEGWSPPENLGPRFNTPAHEYDPALAPDGQRLYFSSNRTAAMQQRIESAAAESQAAPWKATLRAEPAQTTYDLYVAERSQELRTWHRPRSLAGLNLPAANEGEPFVSPDGAFLYFASDRGQNYDLYRARLTTPTLVAENLGPGVNTPAHEHDPALSPEGFRLFFSREEPREAAGSAAAKPAASAAQPYALYSSQAMETYADAGWDTSHRALLPWWWIILALLVLALISALVWYIREVSLRRAPVPGFLLLSLLIHLGLVTGSFFVRFEGETIAEKVRKQFEQFVATRVELSSEHASHRAGEQAYEKVADLQSLAVEQVQPTPREITEAPNMPVPTTTPVASLPSQMTKDVQLDRVAVADPQARPVRQEALRLDRRQQVVARMPAESAVEVETPRAVEQPTEQPSVAKEAIEIAKTTPAVGPSITPVAQPQRQPVNVPTALAQEAVAAEKSATPTNVPATAAPRPTLERVASAAKAVAEAAPVKTEAVAQQQPPAAAEVRPVKEAVATDRTATDSVDAPVPALAINAASSSVPKPSSLVADTPAEPVAATAPSATSKTAPAPVAKVARRARTNVAELAEVEPVAEQVATLDQPKAGADAGDGASPLAVAGINVNVRRTDAGAAFSAPVTTPDVVGGRFNELRRDLAIGSPGKSEVRADVTFSPLASRLERKPARAPLVLYAQDKIGLEAMLQLRVGTEAEKQDLIDAFGGQKETLVTISRGLAWLARVQHADGHWDLRKFANPPPGKNYTGQGKANSDTAATGFALLPFLGDGHTHQSGKYQSQVEQGLRWLVSRQKPDGDLFTGGEPNNRMYSHGIATIALCEAYGMSKDEALKEPAEKAVAFIVRAQHSEGGWRYQPKEAGDMSVVGWQIMALKSGQMAGIAVPQETLDQARKYVTSVRHNSGGFGYQRGQNPSPTMTAEGMLCSQYLGAKRTDPELQRGVEYLRQHVPSVKAGSKESSSYYWYYGTQAMFHIQGETWNSWNTAMSQTVLSSQIKDEGPHHGSWNPRDPWEDAGGRIMATSLRLLMLEVYFRHLPLYQALEQ